METARPRRSKEHGFVLLLCVAAPVVLLALGLWLHPDPRGYGTHEQLGFRPCYPMQAWNVPCPGCGVTTAVALAARGKLIASLATQPLGLGLMSSSVVVAAWAAREHARGRDLALHAPLPWRRMLGILVTVGVLSWAYKIARIRSWL